MVDLLEMQFLMEFVNCFEERERLFVQQSWIWRKQCYQK